MHAEAESVSKVTTVIFLLENQSLISHAQSLVLQLDD